MLWTSRPRHANESKDGPNNLFHHAKKKSILVCYGETHNYYTKQSIVKQQLQSAFV